MHGETVKNDNYFLDAFSKIAKSDYERHVCPSLPIEQLGSNWTDFH